MTTDSIHSFDVNFQEIESTNTIGYAGYSHLKVDNDKIEFLSHEPNDQNIITLNHEFALINVLTIPVAIDVETLKDFNELHFATIINFDLTMFSSIRHLDYSRLSSQDVSINTTDIGIIDLQQTQVSAVIEQGVVGAYHIELYTDVMIKNYGNNTLDDCRITHYVAQGFCGHAVYSEQFSDLNLAPNDSMWISLGLIHRDVNNFSGSTISKEICVYTSHSNFKTDLNVPNNEFCKDIVFGYLDFEENEINEVNIYPNPAQTVLNLGLNTDNLQFLI